MTTTYTLIVGLGASGAAAARFLARRGERVIATDRKPAERLEPIARELANLGVELELGGHRPETFAGASRIVVSPGVPPELPELASARNRGVEVIGEFELACREIRAPLICITGTNGKSTTTSLIGDAVARLGKPTFVGGNLGRPLIEAAGWPTDGLVVAEVSSFQLDGAPSLHPQVAVLLNVTPDHLDRYPSFQAYAESKGQIFRNQTEADHAVVNADDPICLELARRTRAQVHYFHAAPFPGLSLTGRHNEENAQAAFTAARLVGVSEAQIAETARTFRALPHRMELTGTLNGVQFFDDSKGTNVGAVVKSLETFVGGCGKVVIILGGKDKGGSYAPLRPICERVCRAAILIGEATPLIEEALHDVVRCERAATMDQAVARAASHCRAGDVVLLSPACSSYDMFVDYKDRGQRFRNAVLALGATPPSAASGTARGGR